MEQEPTALTRRRLMILLGGLSLAGPWGMLRAQQSRRLVSLGGAVTEIVYALGMGDHLVAVDSTSEYPAAAQELPDVGYFRRLSAEGILSLAPDLVLAAEAAGPERALEQIRSAGVRVARVPDVDDVSDIVRKVRFIGEALGRQADAETLAADFTRRLEQVLAPLSSVKNRPRVLFVLSADAGSPVVGGSGTSADKIIRLAGGRNAAGSIEGYKPVGRESLIATAPDWVLTMSHEVESIGGADQLLARPAFAQTPAGKQGRILAMHGTRLIGMGLRTPDTLAELAANWHPDIPIADAPS